MNLSLIVPKGQCQKIRKLLEENCFTELSSNLRHLGDGNIAIPLHKKAQSNIYDEIDKLLIENGFINRSNFKFNDDTCSSNICTPQILKNTGYYVDYLSFKPKREKVKTPYENLVINIRQILANIGIEMTNDLSKEIPTHWEKHGDLVLFPANCFHSDVWRQIGDEMWKAVCTCLYSSRAAKKDVISADGFRTPQVRLLYGQSGWVEHVDNGIRYTYDISKCMFSAGNVTEKLRIAQFDCKNEVVVDLYAGIGYFTLPYLVHAGARHVHACEWNPDAVEALKKNLRLNGVEDRCTVYQEDNRKICPTQIADRVNLGLIPSSRDGWPVACSALKPTGGFLHIHSNVETKPDISDNCLNEETNTRTELVNTSENRLSEESDSNRPCSESCDKLKSQNKSHDKFSKRQSDKKKIWRQWSENVCETIHDMMCKVYPETHWKVSVCHIEHVKSYAPHVDHLVLDLECQSV